ncbi:hypothetical protein LCM23_06085 [Cytobacillus kochii]|uniref:hypothetical protein n=1 Tax=Cytobacillus kochii TaxID=859143 RepID=UPI001CD3B80E|nr:hypothetical protein [Cytobacillus kochii]MCA1025655.1 hypothetical protein [Cytobacillus kochii]
MAFYFPNVDPAYVYQRKGTSSDPYISLSEEKTVKSNYVTLREIPSFNNKVKVKQLNGTYLSETTNASPTTNQYRVDYSVGLVFFNSIRNNQSLIFEYLGTGYVSFPAERVWVGELDEYGQNSLSTMLENTQSLIDAAQKVAEDNKTIRKEPVANFAAIATSYPSPSHGWSVQTMDDNKFYRYENGQWNFTEIVSNSAITQEQQRIATQLEEMAQEVTDARGAYSTLLEKLNAIEDRLSYLEDGVQPIQRITYEGGTFTTASYTKTISGGSFIN